MRKLLFTLALAGTLSVPSVVFAEATWYGSLRAGVQIGGGNDASLFDGFSRWGIRGSVEAGEGLTAVYRFEHKISTNNASQPGGRLAYAGISGGFGTLTLGQVWSASYNSVGAITDLSNYFGNSETSYRVRSAVSYAYSTDTMNLQIDTIMDPDTDSGESVDQLEFGMSINLGDAAKVALAYVDTNDKTETTMLPDTINPGTPPTINVTPGEAGTPTSVSVMEGTPGTPTTVTVIPAVAAVAEMQATWQNAFNVGTAAEPVWVFAGDAAPGTGDATPEAPTGDAAPTAPTDPQKIAAFNTHFGIFDPTGPLTEGVRGDVEILDQFNMSVTVNAFIPLGTDGVTVTGSGDTATAATAADITVGSGDDAVTIPTGTALSEELRDLAVAFQARSGTIGTVELRQVSDYLAAVEGREIMVTSTTGTAGTPPTVTVEEGTAGTPPTVTVEAGTPPTIMSGGTGQSVVRGSRATHLAMEYNLGGVAAYLGYSQNKANGSSGKDKTTHYGLRGALGDTGLTFRAMARNKQSADGTNSNPWLVGVSKGLDGGAAIHFEHANDDDGKSGKSKVGLHVGF